MTHTATPAHPTTAPSSGRAPTRTDPVAVAASHVVGGPLGRHAVVGRRGWRPAAAVLSALSAVFVALGVLQKNHCVSTGWATPGSLWRACYSDLPVAVAAPAGSSPWSNPTMQGQPPLTALITWLVRTIVPGGSQLRLQQGMFAWGAAVVALLIALAVCASAASRPDSPWVAAHIALSPVLITSALISFDALGVALVAAGLLAWERTRFPLAGVALAGALLTRPTLGAVLVAALVVALVRGRTKGALALFLGAGATCVAMFTVIAVWGGDPFTSFTAWRQQGAGYGSLWYILSFAGVTLSPAVLTGLAVLGWIAAIALGAILAQGRERLPLAPIALLMLVTVMLTSRALPVQACLWVLPLIALSALPWRDHLVWAGAEFVYFITVWGFIARASNMAKALPSGWYCFFTLVRLAGLVYLVTAAIRATRSSTAASSEDDADERRAGLTARQHANAASA